MGIGFALLLSVACGGSTPTAPDEGPGPVGPIGPNGSIGPSDGIGGSGVFVEEDRQAFGVTAVRMDAVGRLYIYQGGAESLTVRAEDNVLPSIRTEVAGGMLEISMAPGTALGNLGPIEIFLTVRELERLEITGAGDVEATDLQVRELRLMSAGSGSMDIVGLDADRLAATLDDSGPIFVSGRVMDQNVTLLGSGSYNARSLRSRWASVRNHGTGSATVRVSETLIVDISSSGSVYYLGDPDVDSTVTGFGELVKLDG
jgi:hypothetical protein